MLRRRACPFHWQAARSYYRVFITHTLPRKLPLHINTARAADNISREIAQTSSTLVTPGIPSIMFQGPTSLYVPPLSYKREDTQRYKTDSKLSRFFRQAPKLTSSDTQYNTQTVE